jgi:L-ascorbate metabolism protein UlaG (beta-lactamase superfamily)
MTEAVCKEKSCYLRSDTKLELLAFRWYAWPHLVAPLQHAMNMAFRHVPLLESYLANPQIHAVTVQDPSMLGAPFVDIPPPQSSQARELLLDTTRRGARLIEVAQAFKELNRRIQAVATGFSLDGEYERLPAALRGVVELVYDTNSHPRIRLLEELAYLQEELDDRDGQEVCVSNVRDVDRKFFLTTPRLRKADALDLQMSFDDPRIDVLASLRTRALPRQQIVEKLQLQPEQAALLDNFLTERAPVRLQPEYAGPGVRVRYFGHACVLVQSAASAVLMDPLTAWERDGSGQNLTFDDLPDRIDYAVLSHCHMDHCCPEMIVQLRHRVRQWAVPRNVCGELADPSMKLLLRRLGCANVIVCDPLDRLPLSDGELVSLPFPGEHCGLDIASKQSMAVTICGRRFLFLVDSDAVDAALYRRLARIVPRADALFIGMECQGAPLSWFYGPLLGKATSRKDDESRRGNASNCARALQAISHIECGDVYVYAMGNESWNRYLLGLEYGEDSIQVTESDKLVDLCRRTGKRAQRLSCSQELQFAPGAAPLLSV